MSDNLTDLGWADLNEAITDINSIDLLEQMIESELRGKRRERHVFRIHSRLNKVRADKERKTLRKRLKDGRPF